MKITNENDNRFTKDILLRQIFQEISNEHRENSPGTPIDDLIPTPEETSSKKVGFLKWIFILIFLTGITYLWFYTVTEVTPENEVQTKSDSYTAPETEQVVQEKEVIKLPEVIKEEPKKLFVIEVTDPNEPIKESPLKVEVPKTEREKAKEALMKQMQK